MSRDRGRPPWASVRALVADVDGVLTDGGLYYAEHGDELKRFDVRDGQGLVLLREAGLLIALVTRKQSTIVAHRARDLGIAEVHQNVTDKAAVVRDLLARHAVAPRDAVYVGDDVGDLPAMALVGVPVAVREAVLAVRRAARYVTRAGGGHGAVREIADLILGGGLRPPSDGRRAPDVALLPASPRTAELRRQSRRSSAPTRPRS